MEHKQNLVTHKLVLSKHDLQSDETKSIKQTDIDIRSIALAFPKD